MTRFQSKQDVIETVVDKGDRVHTGQRLNAPHSLHHKQTHKLSNGGIAHADKGIERRLEETRGGKGRRGEGHASRGKGGGQRRSKGGGQWGGEGGGGGGAHWLEDEHAIVRAQQLSDQQLEELLLDAASINAVLPNEVDPQGLEHIPGLLPGYLIQSILHHINLSHSPCQLHIFASLMRSVFSTAG